MKIAVPKERRPDERRVAVTPDVAKRLIGLGFEVAVEKGAGEAAWFADAAYREAGATIAKDAASLCKEADIVLKVQPPITEAGGEDELGMLRKGTILIGNLAVLGNRKEAAKYARAGVTAFALDLMPRISRAQTMDVLTSQSNLAGYRAAIEAAAAQGRIFPIMMTAAGTLPPAKVLVLGCGVAGLQAIATAKRLGAVVTGYDVRPAVKEEVASLGAKFLEVDLQATSDAQTEGGYAKEMGETYAKKQEAVLTEALKGQDVAICTALIPGRRAPTLITEAMVKGMKPGSVIVDLAVEAGGNCEISEAGKTVVRHGVKIIGCANAPSDLAPDASQFYAKNLLNFLTPLVDRETKSLAINWDDEIVKGTLVTKDGKVVHPMLAKETA